MRLCVRSRTGTPAPFGRQGRTVAMWAAIRVGSPRRTAAPGQGDLGARGGSRFVGCSRMWRGGITIQPALWRSDASTGGTDVIYNPIQRRKDKSHERLSRGASSIRATTSGDCAGDLHRRGGEADSGEALNLPARLTHRFRRNWKIVSDRGTDFSGPRYFLRRSAERDARHYTVLSSVQWNAAKQRLLGDPITYRATAATAPDGASQNPVSPSPGAYEDEQKKETE